MALDLLFWVTVGGLALAVVAASRVVARRPRPSERTALEEVALARGWRVDGGVAQGRSEGRNLVLQLVENGAGERIEHSTRIRVELRSEAAQALDGMTSWHVGDVTSPSSRGGGPEVRRFRDLPQPVAEALGETYEWLLDTSSRVTVRGGELVVDHPEPIDDAGTLDAIVEGVVSYAVSLDTVLSDFRELLP